MAQKPHIVVQHKSWNSHSVLMIWNISQPPRVMYHTFGYSASMTKSPFVCGAYSYQCAHWAWIYRDPLPNSLMRQETMKRKSHFVTLAKTPFVLDRPLLNLCDILRLTTSPANLRIWQHQSYNTPKCFGCCNETYFATVETAKLK